MFEQGLCVTPLASPAQALWLFMKKEVPRQHGVGFRGCGCRAAALVPSAQGAGEGKFQLQQKFVAFIVVLGRGTGSQCSRQPLLVHWVGCETAPSHSSPPFLGAFPVVHIHRDAL